ncbi:MAG: SDR family oxidoreductase [Maribacter sp.]|nr:SDR family oxidoreductase [Maribacter sp.]MBT8301849.1 SDR family oxidoreductase [Maribacter sp.]NNK18250.1 SDR family oxidoreductase [Maribacter sp.]
MQLDFSNKNVLITGGSRGIGKACAKLFASLNANVIFTYKSNKQAAKATLDEMDKKGNHKSYQLDITKPKDIEQVFDTIILDYARVDILINNAGVYIEHKVTAVDYLEWQQCWNETILTNLTGVSNLCYLVSRHMIQNEGGKIINVSSRGAFRGEPNHPAYGASKAGLNAFSQSLAQFLAPFNITVGVVAPGFVETDMAAEILKSETGDQIKKQSPLNRAATADEVARAIVLFSMEGLEYMTGGIIDINGASYLRT